MKFKTACRSLLLFAAALVLSACGGGGGAGDDGSFLSPGVTLRATPTSTSVPAGGSIDITIRGTQGNGAPVFDGTIVRAAVSPGSLGSIVALNANGPVTPGQGQSVQGLTVGGVANFRFTAANPGTATLTFSVVDPIIPSQTIVANVVVNIGPGASRLDIAATRDTLPINAFNVSPFLGSPYMAEVTITARTATGESINLPDGVAVSVNPVGNTGGFSTLDDPTTEDINEFTVRLGQGPVDVVAGRATVFLHSLNFAGTTTMTVTLQDPVTREVTTATRTFTIVSTAPALPSAVILNRASGPQYIQGSGGNTSGQFEIQVRDGIGQPVPDPVAGNTSFNNVRIEIVDAANTGGARLSGVNAAGQSVSGPAINVRTIQGIAGFVLISGDRVGTFVVRAISDRADNNVDNGIQDPVIAQRSVSISDGVLFDLELAVPTVNALQINPVSDDAAIPPGGVVAVPPSPDASYSLTVAVVATDRLGNPVLPGTPINFGLIDEPQALGIGDFLISGNDGDPQEGGTLFTAPTGRFMTAGGGAGPGDGLVVFGEESPGNRDLESARVIARINSQTSLNVQRRFNLNDDTGVSVNNGPVLPYVIGRAADGNIVANAFTNELGVARTVMTYPVNRLGKRAIVWAQGDGVIVGGSPETVTDVELVSFAGVAPASVTASPSTIPANTSQQILLCIIDALGSPIQGVQFGFSFSGVSGTATVDGIQGSGAVQQLTGANGCTTATVRTAGLLERAGVETLVTFFAGGDSADVTITFSPLVLSARPSALTGSGDVTLTLLNGNGVPQPGIQIFGTCTSTGGATISITDGPGITNANGQTTATISAFNLDQINGSGSGTCTFRTADPTINAVVTLQGRDICELNFSPPPQGCPVQNVTLTVVITGGAGTVVSAPGGINCTRPVGATGSQTCTASFVTGTAVVLTATNTSNGDTVQPAFSGECSEINRTPGTASTAESVNAGVSMTGARTCNVVFAP